MQHQCILSGNKTGPVVMPHQAPPYSVLQEHRGKQPRSPMSSIRHHDVARNAKWLSDGLSALCRRTQYMFDAFDVVTLESVRSGDSSKRTSEPHSTSPTRLCSRHRTCGPIVFELTWRSHTRASQRAVTPVVGVSEERNASISKS